MLAAIGPVWRGEKPLWQTYWLYGLGLWVVLFVLTGTIAADDNGTIVDLAANPLALVAMLIFGAFHVFAFVAVWRASKPISNSLTGIGARFTWMLLFVLWLLPFLDGIL